MIGIRHSRLIAERERDGTGSALPFSDTHTYTNDSTVQENEARSCRINVSLQLYSPYTASLPTSCWDGSAEMKRGDEELTFLVYRGARHVWFDLGSNRVCTE